MNSFHFDCSKPHMPAGAKVLAFTATQEKVEEARDVAKEVLHALDYPTWLPHSAKVYHISPDINDYILVTTIICPSDIPNRNGIGFPLNELVAFAPPPTNRQVYAAWRGCPVYLEHNNRDLTKAHGVVLDTKLVPIVGYGNKRLWKVMGLLAIDCKKYPEIAAKVRSGEINTYSMGAYANLFSCSYCHTPMKQDARGNISCCVHLNPKQDIDWSFVDGPDGRKHLVYRRAHQLSPFEVSIVEDPAWVPALSDKVQAFDGSPTGGLHLEI